MTEDTDLRSMFDPDEWTTRHTYRPEPSETSPAPGWVRRAAPPATPHKCQPPMRVVTALPPPPFPGDGPPPAHTVRTIPDGNPGDVWRCQCSRLWRRWYRVEGILTLAVWDPAPWWLRLRYRRTPGSAS